MESKVNKKVIGIGLTILAISIFRLIHENDMPVVPSSSTEVAVQPASDISITASEIIRVSDFEQVLGEKPAVSIVFGESETKWCDLAIQRHNVSEGYKIVSERSARYNEVSLSCNSEKSLYLSSAHHPTRINLELVSVDIDNKKAEAVVSAKLINSDRVTRNQTDEYAELKNVRLVITGQHFENLMKQM